MEKEITVTIHRGLDTMEIGLFYCANFSIMINFLNRKMLNILSKFAQLLISRKLVCVKLSSLVNILQWF